MRARSLFNRIFRFGRTSDDTVTREERSGIATIIADNVPTPVKTQEELLPQSIPFIDHKKALENKISIKIENEKKESLLSVVNKLKAKIDEKISKLNLIITSYEKSVAKYEQLTSLLASEEHISRTAEKFSYNRTESRTRYETEYKDVFTGVCSLCMRMSCEHGTFYMHSRVSNQVLITEQVNVPVYVSDENRRENAKRNCKRIRYDLSVQFNYQYPIKPLEVSKKEKLTSCNNHLENLRSKINIANTDTLNALLKTYQQLLKEAMNTMEINDKTFISQYSPRSDYAQIYVASRWVRLIEHQNIFFASLPEDLKQLIVDFTAKSLPPDVKRHVFQMSLIHKVNLEELKLKIATEELVSFFKELPYPDRKEGYEDFMEHNKGSKTVTSSKSEDSRNTSLPDNENSTTTSINPISDSDEEKSEADKFKNIMLDGFIKFNPSMGNIYLRWFDKDHGQNRIHVFKNLLKSAKTNFQIYAVLYAFLLDEKGINIKKCVLNEFKIQYDDKLTPENLLNHIRFKMIALIEHSFLLSDKGKWVLFNADQQLKLTEQLRQPNIVKVNRELTQHLKNKQSVKNDLHKRDIEINRFYTNEAVAISKFTKNIPASCPSYESELPNSLQIMFRARAINRFAQIHKKVILELIKLVDSREKYDEKKPDKYSDLMDILMDRDPLTIKGHTALKYTGYLDFFRSMRQTHLDQERLGITETYPFNNI